MPPADAHSARSKREIHEALRRHIGEQDIHTVVLPHSPRPVRLRNVEERPRVADAILLDDLWQVLDDHLLGGTEGGAR